MKRFLSLLLSVTLVIGLCACGGKKEEPLTWQEQYDLGVRYLSDGNYEEAVLAFKAAIEIDPKQPDAYVGLSDAYIGLGDYEKALQAIEDGQKNCGDTYSFTRVEESVDFLRSGDMGIRITDFYFDKEAYCNGEENNFLVSVAYCCPENVESILMIGANTAEPYRFRMLNKDYSVTGSGGYQFNVTITPTQWDETNFGVYVNLSEAAHGDSWTPFGSDVLFIDPEGNVVGVESIG